MLEVVPTGAALGAEVQGVDLRRVDDATFAAVHRAWVNHAVLLFRGQSLNDDELIAFSRRFGALDWAPVQENGRRFVEGKPELYIVSNVLENGVAIGSLGAGERSGTPTCPISTTRPRRACSMRSKSAAGRRTRRSAACMRA